MPAIERGQLRRSPQSLCGGDADRGGTVPPTLKQSGGTEQPRPAPFATSRGRGAAHSNTASNCPRSTHTAGAYTHLITQVSSHTGFIRLKRTTSTRRDPIMLRPAIFALIGALVSRTNQVSRVGEELLERVVTYPSILTHSCCCHGHPQTALRAAAVPTSGDVAWAPLAYGGTDQWAPVDNGALDVDPNTGDAYAALTFSGGA